MKNYIHVKFYIYSFFIIMKEMNYIDLSILILFIIFIGIGLWRGFLNEFLTFFGFVISSILSFIFYSALGQKIYEELQIPSGLSNLISFILIFLVLQIIWSFFSTFIYRKIYQKWGEFRKFRKLDSALGAIPSLLNGFVVISLLLLILVIVPIHPRVKSHLSDSRLASFFVNNASLLNDKIEKLFIPAAGEAEAKIRNLTGTFFPEKETEVNFPENLQLSPDSQAEKRMFELINMERIRRGINPLVFDSELTEVARNHSEEMFRLSYFDHNSPVTGSPFDRLDAAGIKYLAAGENIAYAPNVDVAHFGLMDSPSHRENILEPSFQKIGIGIISAGPWGMMFSQEFTD